MCGVIGIVAKSPVNQMLYEGLTLLQHRGQDAAGIMSCEHDRFFLYKNNGMVRDVFHSTRHMINLRGNMGIGHVRYPTAGCSSTAEAQPLYVNSPYGICLAHNGNLTNSEALRNDLMSVDLRHLNTSSDSEVLLNIFAHAIGQGHRPRTEITAEHVFASVANVHNRCRGGYAVVVMISGVGLLGFRDPNGIRPIIFGRRDTRAGVEYIIASESVAIKGLGFEVVRDLCPGEAIFVGVDGVLHHQQCAQTQRHTPCIFEYVYLARPDSMIDGISVYHARMRMGETLADRILGLHPDHDIDVVIPIPDSSRPAALPLANRLEVKYREGFIKNRYIPRTFIMPRQDVRQRSVRQKLSAIELEFKNKNVLLVDDSIVRGTTSREIVQMARDAGARRVYFASAAPPVRFQNVYGIDMPVVEELIAYNRTPEKVAAEIGADWLVYQDMADLVSAVRQGSPDITEFDTSCFTGEYVTGDVDSDYLHSLELQRSREERSDNNLDLTDLSGGNYIASS